MNDLILERLKEISQLQSNISQIKKHKAEKDKISLNFPCKLF